MPITAASDSKLFTADKFKNKYWLIIFIVYLVLLGTVVARHEPWMDEAQPWIYGEEVNPFDLLTKLLRYDGHPPLWYLIVMPFAKIGLPYFTLNVLSAFFSALGVLLFLRYSPFSPIIKILFPFTFFVFYQYGIVARSYCLIAPLLFFIAVIYEKKNERPLLFAFLLCLLASVSAFTFLMAGAIFFVHLLDVVKRRKSLNRNEIIYQFIAAVLLILTAAAVVLILAQPPDSSFAQGYNLKLKNFIDVAWRRLSGALIMDELSNFTKLQAVGSCIIFIFSLIWFWYKKTFLLFSLPCLLITILSAVKYSNVWHEGILFILWIFVLWVSFKNEYTEPPILRKIIKLAAVIVLATQVYWTGHAAFKDYKYNYSGAYELSQFIKNNKLENKKLFVSGWKSLAIMPYFDENVFYNYNEGAKNRYWLWSIYNRNMLGAGQEVINRIEKEQPDFAVFASDHIDIYSEIRIPGYDLIQVFEGNLYWKTGLFEPDSFFVYRKRQ
jgi:hypothetical protein